MLFEAVMSRPVHKTLLSADVFRTMQARYRQARVFVFDGAASTALGNFSIDCADLVVKNEEFAIPPFENCYIEIDNKASLQDAVGDATERLGYWFIDRSVYCFAGEEKDPRVVPLSYRRAADSELGKHSDMPPEYTSAKKNIFLGQVSPELEWMRDKLAGRLADRWHCAMTAYVPEDVFRAVATETAGDLKRALAAILLLNQRQTYSVTGKPPTRKIVNGKQRVYLAHNVVTIDLASKVLRKAFYTGLRGTPRAHEVRGEFVHRYRVAGCTHEWEKIDDPEREQADMDRLGYVVPRWECKHCTGLRSWRKSHQRGDASKGFVTKAYEVTKTS